MTYCKKCRKKDRCVKICGRLEAHLKRGEVYQREIPMAPGKLALAAERSDSAWRDFLPEIRLPWEVVSELTPALPPRLRMSFIMYYHDGKKITEIARTLGLHRVTIARRLLAAESIVIRQARQEKISLKFLADEDEQRD